MDPESMCGVETIYRNITGKCISEARSSHQLDFLKVKVKGIKFWGFFAKDIPVLLIWLHSHIEDFIL